MEHAPLMTAAEQLTPPAVSRARLRAGEKPVRSLCRGIILDLEGTLTSRSYVQDVLWPYARRNMAGVLRSHWFESSVIRIREQLARDAGGRSFEIWCGTDSRSAEAYVKTFDELLRLSKLPKTSQPLRDMVELTWREGYRNDALKSHIYPDVEEALTVWGEAGRQIRTYSTLTVATQCALLAKTESGNLVGYFNDHNDAELGPKTAPGSFCTIADEMRFAPADLLYAADDPAELDAARIAGFSTVFVLRPTNPPPPSGMLHPIVRDLRSILMH
jgi:enolase-phosphatase E1